MSTWKWHQNNDQKDIFRGMILYLSVGHVEDLVGRWRIDVECLSRKVSTLREGVDSALWQDVRGNGWSESNWGPGAAGGIRGQSPLQAAAHERLGGWQHSARCRCWGLKCRPLWLVLGLGVAGTGTPSLRWRGPGHPRDNCGAAQSSPRVWLRVGRGQPFWFPSCSGSAVHCGSQLTLSLPSLPGLFFQQWRSYYHISVCQQFVLNWESPAFFYLNKSLCSMWLFNL